MKVKLVLGRTTTDNVANTWLEMKTVDVEIPLEKQNEYGFPWQVIGAEWPQDTEGKDG